MERKLYVEVNKAIEAFGGKWNKSKKCHVFKDKLLLEEIGKLLSDEPIEYTDLKKDLEWFETPPELAKKMVAKLGRIGEEFVLEPNIGRGGIAKFLECPKDQVIGYDIHQPFIDELSDLGYKNLSCGDFLDSSRFAPGYKEFSYIIMNPPFHNGSDCRHVLHAWKFLAPGGILVAVTSPAWKCRKGGIFQEFKALVEEFGNGEEEDIPEGTFKEAGTNVKTVLVTLRKPE